MAQNQSSPLCRHFQAGLCRYGGRCRYRHGPLHHNYSPASVRPGNAQQHPWFARAKQQGGGLFHPGGGVFSPFQTPTYGSGFNDPFPAQRQHQAPCTLTSLKVMYTADATYRRFSVENATYDELRRVLASHSASPAVSLWCTSPQNKLTRPFLV